MEKLELIDAEKRARRSDVQRCGVDSLLVNDIPFGVRAIQRGVEVEGIWISNPNTPELSQVASSATLIGDQQESRDSNKKAQAGQRSREPSKSIGSSTNEATRPEPPALWPHMSVPTSSRSIRQPQSGLDGLPNTDDAALRSHPNSYVPRRTARRRGIVERRHRTPTLAAENVCNTESHGADLESNDGRLDQASIDLPLGRDDRHLHRSLNADSARTDRERHEMSRVNEGEGDDIGRNQAPRPRRHKLSRKPPRAQLR